MHIKKILCPTDYSDHSAIAVEYAQKFTEKFNAQLHLLHVIDDVYQYWVAGTENAAPFIISTTEIMDAANNNMQNFIDKYFTNFNGELIRATAQGKPYVAITDYAKEHDIDMIIISTHGHSALTQMLIGSVTERVIRKAHCPVLTIRDRK
ncbi:MAG: universal stress protein [Phycisphaerae bacterium]|nr:universal stress protein [Phycisphaerae bacterium]